MNYKPILLNDEMVRAAHDGSMTQIRRPVIHQGRPLGEFAFFEVDGNEIRTENGDTMRCPFGGPGDRLWVREAWRCNQDDIDDPLELNFRADDAVQYIDPDSVQYEKYNDWTWRPNSHMPRWASRTTLDVLRVWVEQIQDISDADIRAEGIRGDTYPELGQPCAEDPRSARIYFMDLWNSIYGTWDDNPWVQCCEFRLTERTSK